MSTTTDQPRVAVVITTFNDARFLADALRSVYAQTRPVDEVIVVDDGSDEDPAAVLDAFPDATLIRKQNGGLASARNTGLYHATSNYICFLDADDRLQPRAIAAGAACFVKNPQAAMVYGGHRRIGTQGESLGDGIYQKLGSDPYATLLTLNIIGMHAAALFRRDLLIELKGYDEQLRRGEDYDLYLRLAQSHSIASHPEIVADYRWHGQNMSTDTEQMLQAILSIHDRHRPESGPRLDFWLQGRRNWKDWYSRGQREIWGEQPPNTSAVVRAKRSFKRLARRSLPDKLLRFIKGESRPRRGEIDFGSLAATRPISRNFGWDRGTPVDRYYIEQFLRSRSEDIRGRVLEVGDDSYSRQFGTGVTQQDVLHLNSDDPKITIKGHLATPGLLPENAFDCIIFTQTLHFIFELSEAVQCLYRALKPGGILLLTTPGISQLDRNEWAANWNWSFTAASIHRLFHIDFRPGELEVTTHGNVFAAVSFLTGAVQEELDKRKLDVHDPAYPVIITLRAQRL